MTVMLKELAAGNLYQILQGPNNPVIISKKPEFTPYGIELCFEDQALKMLAEHDAELGTGARALVSVLEKTLLPFTKRLPLTDIRELRPTPELVAPIPRVPWSVCWSISATPGWRGASPRPPDRNAWNCSK
ncbi:hypothetical protein DFAR_3980004 [Desulfarculales bacterium]